MSDAIAYTRLGRTGLKVSRLCLGTMNFGPQTSEAESFGIMDRALELGINFFDTADVYGWTKGEGVTEQSSALVRAGRGKAGEGGADHEGLWDDGGLAQRVQALGPVYPAGVRGEPAPSQDGFY